MKTWYLLELPRFNLAVCLALGVKLLSICFMCNPYPHNCHDSGPMSCIRLTGL